MTEPTPPQQPAPSNTADTPAVADAETNVHRVSLAEGCDFPDETSDPAITLLLDAYRSRSATADPESGGWVPRVATVEGVEDEDVPAVHGMAIAADLLEIQIEDAQTGLQYRARRAA